ncbi:hypothetical protein E2C01_068045 [Portunus trituberculatus]|uniref:PiggyBac transposable element-derived protein domain-containing protein n=1 Tax=Portunus trituberculatus TaxID=210409 RepID=A0A5B7HYF2_PORTR|nr:hypothetical protein [Portunus trituberculatus]
MSDQASDSDPEYVPGDSEDSDDSCASDCDYDTNDDIGNDVEPVVDQGWRFMGDPFSDTRPDPLPLFHGVMDDADLAMPSTTTVPSFTSPKDAFIHIFDNNVVDAMSYSTPEIASSHLSMSESVVVYLMRGLLEEGRHVVTNKWYTSLRLGEYLLTKNTTMTGVVRADRGPPKTLAAERLQCHQSTFARKGNTLVVKYQDKKEVDVLTTHYIANLVEKTKTYFGDRHTFYYKPQHIERKKKKKPCHVYSREFSLRKDTIYHCPGCPGEPALCCHNHYISYHGHGEAEAPKIAPRKKGGAKGGPKPKPWEPQPGLSGTGTH